MTLFSSLGSFWRYAKIEKRVAWPVALSFGLGIFISIGGVTGGMLGSLAQKMFSEMTLKIVLACTLLFLFFRFFKIEIWV